MSKEKSVENEFYSWITWVYDSVLDGSFGVNDLTDEFLTTGAELALLFYAQQKDKES